jgi:hypothetical protein
MDGVRRGAYQVYRVLIALIAAACVVQIFLAGRGVFGIHGTASLDDQKSLNAHRDLGELIGIGTVVVFLLALAMWNKRLIIWTFVLALLAEIVQHATALPKHPWVAGLHPVSGVAILGISAYLAHAAWAKRGVSAPS